MTTRPPGQPMGPTRNPAGPHGLPSQNPGMRNGMPNSMGPGYGANGAAPPLNIRMDGGPPGPAGGGPYKGTGPRTGSMRSTGMGPRTGSMRSTGMGSRTGSMRSTGMGPRTGSMRITGMDSRTGSMRSTGMGSRTGSMRSTGMGSRTGSMRSTGMGPRTGSMRSTGMGSRTGSMRSTGMGPRTGSMRSTGMGPRTGSMRSTGMDSRTGSMNGNFGSMQRKNSNMGSMYGMGGPMGGSMYGTGGPMGMGGSMYGMGGPMGMGGSMYGMGGPMGMGGSMYGMGGPMGGSMYGMGGPMGMGGSMYGMGGPMGMGGSMYGMGGPMGMGGSMYGIQGPSGGIYSSVVDAVSRRDGFLSRNSIIQSKEASRVAVKDQKPATENNNHAKDDKKDAKTSTSTTKDEKASASVTKEARSLNSTSLQSAKPPEDDKKEAANKSKTEDTKDKKDAGDSTSAVKTPTGTNIRGVAVIVKKASDASSAAVKVKDATTLATSSGDEFLLDEVLTHTETSKVMQSVMLDDLRRHWLAGHNSTLLLGAAKGQSKAAVELGSRFLSDALSRVERDGRKFDVSVTMVAFKDRTEAKDLLKSGASYGKMQMVSSPVFGPALGGLTSKMITKSNECETVLADGIKNSKNPAELVVGFFVLKQIRRSSANDETVYVSSLCVVFAGEEVSHFTALKEKKPSEPYVLLRYAIGGASTTVCLLAVSAEKGQESDAKKVLEVGKAMREVKNSVPRSGNVKHFVEFTKKELPKQKENAERNESVKKVVERMELMLKDAEELLAKPETQPKTY